jgi:hypothetical protein
LFFGFLDPQPRQFGVAFEDVDNRHVEDLTVRTGPPVTVKGRITMIPSDGAASSVSGVEVELRHWRVQTVCLGEYVPNAEKDPEFLRNTKIVA